MNGMVVKRDEFFDSLKFFLISLVILGHTLEISEKTRVVLALYNTIYSFHMPLFIFISGYFSRKYDDNSLFYRKILGLVETYLTFQLVFSIPSILSGNIWTVIVRPWWVLWYLLLFFILIDLFLQYYMVQYPILHYWGYVVALFNLFLAA